MILIVDDDKSSGHALERLLQLAGHEAIAVTGGAKALAMVRIQKPSLMVLDVNMPQWDGLAVLRFIRDHAEVGGFPVLMFTSEISDKARVDAMRLGATEFLVKGTVAVKEIIERIVHLADYGTNCPPAFDQSQAAQHEPIKHLGTTL